MIKVTNVKGNFTTNQTELRSEEIRPENIKIQSVAQRCIPTWMKISAACGILAAFGVIAYKNEWFSFNGFNVDPTPDNLKKQCESTLPDTYKLDPSATVRQNQDFVSIGNSFDGQNGIGCVWLKAGQDASLSAGEFQDSQLIKGVQLVGSMNEEGQLHGDNCVKIEKKSANSWTVLNTTTADSWTDLTRTRTEKGIFEIGKLMRGSVEIVYSYTEENNKDPSRLLKKTMESGSFDINGDLHGEKGSSKLEKYDGRPRERYSITSEGKFEHGKLVNGTRIYEDSFGTFIKTGTFNENLHLHGPSCSSSHKTLCAETSNGPLCSYGGVQEKLLEGNFENGKFKGGKDCRMKIIKGQDGWFFPPDFKEKVGRGTCENENLVDGVATCTDFSGKQTEYKVPYPNMRWDLDGCELSHLTDKERLDAGYRILNASLPKEE